ncbi:transposable element Tc1 transposase [Trichonephila clavipes]|uniref:Transposable element Tc1 transposase n=1 Tax=Trichonephila clavipes TaxID=2585209 RepID=A0A8X6VV14_TRICX|nr:transposable element Tc1 transposase [Trichonephila clavipes]
MSASSSRLQHRRLRARVPLFRIPPHDKSLLTASHEHRVWEADWPHVVLSHESRFNLWDHDGRFRVRCYTGECCLPECVIERHSDLTLGLRFWAAISNHRRYNLL